MFRAFDDRYRVYDTERILYVFFAVADSKSTSAVYYEPKIYPITHPSDRVSRAFEMCRRVATIDNGSDDDYGLKLGQIYTCDNSMFIVDREIDYPMTRLHYTEVKDYVKMYAKNNNFDRIILFVPDMTENYITNGIILQNFILDGLEAHTV